jgi:hypothetical protein
VPGKSVLLTVALALHDLDRLIEFWRETTDFIAANHALFAEMKVMFFGPLPDRRGP